MYTLYEEVNKLDLNQSQYGSSELSYVSRAYYLISPLFTFLPIITNKIIISSACFFQLILIHL